MNSAGELPAAGAAAPSAPPDRALRVRRIGRAEIERDKRLEVLCRLARSRRDILRQDPASDGRPRGVFSLRSPVRPNPIGTSIVRLERVEEMAMLVRGLDCLDLTPLLDLKPDRTLFTPAAPTKSTIDKTDEAPTIGN